MQGDVGQQVDGQLKHIERFAAAREVKAIPCVAALRSLAKGFSLTNCTPQVRVSGRAVFIHANENAVVTCRILIKQMSVGKKRDHLTVDTAVLCQVGKHTAHIPVGSRQSEFFR